MHAFRRDAMTADSESPGINWPQTFVALSVVGVAAWGIWFFMQNRSDAAPEPAPAKLPPLPILPQIPGAKPALIPGVLPSLVPGLPDQPEAPPAPPAPPAAPIFLVGDPLILKEGQHYRAKLKLSGLQATFATKDLIQAQFLSNGFSDVIAYKTAAQLPSDWPSSTTAAGSGVWWAEGNWARASGPVPRQEQISQVWEA